MSFELSDRTRQILANFSSINSAILFRPGNVVRTISPGRDMFATANITEEFPQEFAVYDLSRFLGVLSLFEKYALTFKDKFLTIKSENRQINYVFAALSMIEAAPNKDMGMPDTVAEFDLDAKTLSALNKTLGFLKLPQVVFQSDGKSIDLQAVDLKDPTGDSYLQRVGSATKQFKVIFNAEKISKLLDGETYKVTIGHGELNGQVISVAQFESKDIKYYVGPEEESQYE